MYYHLYPSSVNLHVELTRSILETANSLPADLQARAQKLLNRRNGLIRLLILHGETNTRPGKSKLQCNINNSFDYKKLKPFPVRLEILQEALRRTPPDSRVISIDVAKQARAAVFQRLFPYVSSPRNVSSPVEEITDNKLDIPMLPRVPVLHQSFISSELGSAADSAPQSVPASQASSWNHLDVENNTFSLPFSANAGRSHVIIQPSLLSAMDPYQQQQQRWSQPTQPNLAVPQMKAAMSPAFDAATVEIDQLQRTAAMQATQIAQLHSEKLALTARVTSLEKLLAKATAVATTTARTAMEDSAPPPPPAAAVMTAADEELKLGACGNKMQLPYSKTEIPISNNNSHNPPTFPSHSLLQPPSEGNELDASDSSATITFNTPGPVYTVISPVNVPSSIQYNCQQHQQQPSEGVDIYAAETEISFNTLPLGVTNSEAPFPPEATSSSSSSSSPPAVLLFPPEVVSSALPPETTSSSSDALLLPPEAISSAIQPETIYSESSSLPHQTVSSDCRLKSF